MNISREINFKRVEKDIRAMPKNVFIKALKDNRVWEIAPHLENENNTSEKIVKVKYTTDSRESMNLNRENTIVHDYTVDSWSLYYNWLSPEIVSIHIIDCWYNSRNFLVETTPSQRKNIKAKYGQFVTTGYFKESSDIIDLKAGITAYLDANLDINPVRDYQTFFDNFTKSDFIKATLWTHKAFKNRLAENNKKVTPNTAKLLEQKEQKEPTPVADQYTAFKELCTNHKYRTVLEQYLTSITDQVDQYKKMVEDNESYKLSKGAEKRRKDILKTKIILSGMLTDLQVSCSGYTYKEGGDSYLKVFITSTNNDVGVITKKYVADYINSLVYYMAFKYDLFIIADGVLTTDGEKRYRQAFTINKKDYETFKDTIALVSNEIRQGANYFDSKTINLNI